MGRVEFEERYTSGSEPTVTVILKLDGQAIDAETRSAFVPQGCSDVLRAAFREGDAAFIRHDLMHRHFDLARLAFPAWAKKHENCTSGHRTPVNVGSVQ